MAKRLNLVVFIDGTGNNFFKQEGCNSTNISRLWKACEHAGTEDVEQRTYYKPGIGDKVEGVCAADCANVQMAAGAWRGGHVEASASQRNEHR